MPVKVWSEQSPVSSVARIQCFWAAQVSAAAHSSASSAEDSPEDSADCAAAKGEEQPVGIRQSVLSGKIRDNTQNQKVEDTAGQSPEEPAAFDAFSCEKAPGKAGDGIDDKDRRGDLGLWQVQPVEGQGQQKKQDPGQQIGNKKGAQQGFGNGWVHE